MRKHLQERVSNLIQKGGKMNKKDIEGQHSTALNTFLGKKEICELMLRHKAAQFIIPPKRRRFASKICPTLIRICGFPLEPVSRIRAKRIIRYLSSLGRGLLLDVGCTFGVYSFELARRGYDVIGIDTNEESIALGSKIKNILGIKKALFLHQDILNNDFSGGKFDVIIMIEVLEHIKEDVKAIQRLNRILKDDGIIVISVPYAEKMEEYIEPIGACQTIRGDTVSIGEGGGHYRNGYNLQSLISLLENNKFLVIDHTYTKIQKMFQKSMVWFPLVYPLSLLLARFSRNRLKLTVIARKVKSSSMEEK